MKMKFIIAALLMGALAPTSTYACETPMLCEIEEVTGEIPCVTLRTSEIDDCTLIATSTCPLAERPTLTLDNRASYDWIGDQVSFYLGYAPPEGVTHTISWTLSDQSGEATLRLKDKPVQSSSDPLDFSSCGSGPICAATPPQRPASPLTALLPMLLGALICRRSRER